MTITAGKIKFDEAGKHFFETGVENCVLYLQEINSSTHKAEYPKGVAWNGITSIQEAPSGADENALYADNVKYLSLRAAEDFGGTIEAYTYPDEWLLCDGMEEIVPGAVIGMQGRKTFGLSYITRVGNDVDGDAYGNKLHLIWGATASPSDRQYETVNDSPDAVQFSWEISTIPVEVSGYKKTSWMTIDQKKIGDTKWNQLIDLLHGKDAVTGENASDATFAKLPTPDEVIDLLTAN